MNPAPLSARVTAPAEIAVPTGPDGIVWRPATEADIDALLDCALEVGAVDHPNYVNSREEFEDDFAQEFFAPEVDSMIAVRDDGSIAAWGFVLIPPGQETLVRSILFGGVRPTLRGQGIGRRLFAWQQQRALQQLASSEKELPGWMLVFAEDHQATARALYEHEGFAISRYFLQLIRRIGSDAPAVEAVPPPDGIRLERYTDDWAERLRLARNDAFRDHWGSQPTSEDQWSKWIARSVFSAEHTWLALADDDRGEPEIAGFVVASVNRDDWEAQGFPHAYIDLVGVPRAWRKRGIAPAVLAAALASIEAGGLEGAVLDVDAESPTGALGLYEGVGFTEASRSIGYVREF